MRTWLIALSLFIALPALAAPDYAREKRWDEEVSPGIVVGEAVYLEQKNKHRFLAIYTEAPKARVALVVTHGIGIHPDWGLIGTLRQRLPDHGYTTLSIQLPVLAVEAKYEDYVPIFPDAVERLKLAVDFLKAKGYARVAIVSHSLGGHMTHEYLSAYPDGAQAWASLGISRGRTYEKFKLPVLDLYGSSDLPQVVADGGKRKDSLAGKPGSKQVVISGANHFFADQEDAMVMAVKEFLDGVK
jgi:pimeloyl-ACP methyl ester carboxylesterase